MSAPFMLNATNADTPFPPVELALPEPNGLLAIGGTLSAERLLNAYQRGIFPWYSEGQPVLWWSPDPRSVLFPEHLRVNRSLRKTLRQGRFDITLDCAFDRVIERCALTPRPGQEGTWIVDEMLDAYSNLHRLGHAHSAEAWRDGELVGGLYGVAIGRVFFGESMFSTVSEASKVAFVHLVQTLTQWQYRMIDCQMETAHLNRFGAANIPRQRFVTLLQRWCPLAPAPESWSVPCQEPPLAGPQP